MLKRAFAVALTCGFVHYANRPKLPIAHASAQ